MPEFIIGATVVHPVHGPCTVTFVGETRVGVQFADGSNALLLKESFSPDYKWTRRDLQAREEAMARPASWPESTFFPCAPEVQHYMGAHWEPFTEDPELIVAGLPELMAKAQLLMGFGSFYEAPRPLPDGWPKGAQVIWPGPENGIVVTVRTGEEAHMITSFYPCIHGADETTVQIDKVVLWEEGVDAQLRVCWNGIPFSFFDTHFLANRAWYEAGETYDFILAGIAYSARPAEVMDLPYTSNPEQVQWQAILNEMQGRPPEETPKYLSLRGIAMLIPIDGWDIDEYQFRGPVRRVRPGPALLDSPSWFVRLPLMRSDDQEFEVEVLITERAWAGREPPIENQDIEGYLWLQGRMWSAESLRKRDPKNSGT